MKTMEYNSELIFEGSDFETIKTRLLQLTNEEKENTGYLMITDCDIDDEDFDDLLKILEKFNLPNLTTIELSRNHTKLSGETIENLAKFCVKKNIDLDCLILDGNDFDSDNVDAIVDLIKNQPNIYYLSLNNNFINDNDVFKLVQVLLDHPMQSFSLAQNEITDVGISYLMPLIQNNPRMELDVSQANLDAEIPIAGHVEENQE